MKLLRILTKYFIIVFASLFLILIALTAIYKDRVAGMFVNEINNRTQIKTNISSSRLTLLRRFPRASFTLKDVVVHSSEGFTGNDTLVAASEVSLEFRISDLLKKRYIIERIAISDGFVNIATDSSGLTSYPPSDSNKVAGPGSGVTVNLNNIRLTNIRLSVSNQIKNAESIVRFHSARLSGAVAGTNIGLKATGDFQIEKVKAAGIVMKYPVDGSISLAMRKSDTEITMEKGRLNLESMSFEVEGVFSPSSGLTDILISATDVDIVKLAGFLPEKYSSFTRLRPAGKVSATFKADGILTKESMLHYEVAFSVSGARLEIPGTGIKLTDSYLEGTYTNGVQNNAVSSVLSLTRIDLKSGESFLSGTIDVKDFTGMTVQADIVTLLDLSLVVPLLKNDKISGGEGTVRGSVEFRGKIPGKGKIDMRQILGLNPRGNIYLNDAGISLPDYIFTDIDGNLMLSQTLWVDNMSFSLNGQRALANGQILDFLFWIRGDATKVKIDGSIAADMIDPALIMGERDPASTRAPVLMPYGYDIKLRFSAAEFHHKTFSATEVAGLLNYSTNVARLDTFSMTSMGGQMNGSVTLVKKGNGSYSSDSRVHFSEIDINRAFMSFKNFRQDFILAENLKGSLSGRHTMRMDLDSMLMPVLSSISSEGQFSIIDGELINFEPIKEISDFIDISELENIKFSKLENEFFISGETFAIPQMEINSSAVDLGIYGKHMFNGDYEYHVRLFLSQILSGKAPKKGPNNEFGIVEDDGYGRTSLFLKLTRKGNADAVNFDMEATKSEVKQSLKQEKQSLRSILNEEYGWFSKDTSVVPVKEQKPKFRINWEEGITPPDTSNQDTIKKDKKNTGIKNLLNKIKKG